MRRPRSRRSDARCPGCSLSGPGGLGFLPALRHRGRPGQPAAGVPAAARAGGNILTVLLAVVVAAVAARLVIELADLGSAHWRRGFVDLRFDKAAGITIFVTGIVFLVWFRRARIKAEQRGCRQRRARGWAFWGWIVPVVSWWFPFQVMGDIWRAGLPARQRRDTASLPALWWTSWLLRGTRPASPPQRAYSWPYLSAGTWTATLCLLAVIRPDADHHHPRRIRRPVASPHPSPPATLPAAPPASPD